MSIAYIHHNEILPELTPTMIWSNSNMVPLEDFPAMIWAHYNIIPL